ncbi:MAG: hypothetical protein KA314_02485 [Chloroflexi bacterium]|nr:hypothetical protein [Chloroflexota bacterium]MBP8054675.1 hypothetical protein [Chloroflexota bacterium]
MQLSGTVTPWLVGGFVVLALVTLAQTMRSWRDAKRSPYFFLRLQAQKRLRQYSSASLILVILASGIAAYGWETPEEEVTRSAILVNNKPVAAAVTDEAMVQIAETPPTVLVLGPTSSLIDNPPISPSVSPSSTTFALPTEYNTISPTASLQDNTELGTLAFSTNVNDRYEAINPGRTFGEGSYTLYATFAYEAMSDGMAWSWVWMRDGKLISGGNEVWRYGDDGPGYVFLNPEEGFAAGQYTLGVWVNGKLMVEGNFQITTSAASQR